MKNFLLGFTFGLATGWMIPPLELLHVLASAAKAVAEALIGRVSKLFDPEPTAFNVGYYVGEMLIVWILLFIFFSGIAAS